MHWVLDFVISHLGKLSQFYGPSVDMDHKISVISSALNSGGIIGTQPVVGSDGIILESAHKMFLQLRFHPTIWIWKTASGISKIELGKVSMSGVPASKDGEAFEETPTHYLPANTIINKMI